MVSKKLKTILVIKIFLGLLLTSISYAESEEKSKLTDFKALQISQQANAYEIDTDFFNAQIDILQEENRFRYSGYLNQDFTSFFPKENNFLIDVTRRYTLLPSLAGEYSKVTMAHIFLNDIRAGFYQRTDNAGNNSGAFFASSLEDNQRLADANWTENNGVFNYYGLLNTKVSFSHNDSSITSKWKIGGQEFNGTKNGNRYEVLRKEDGGTVLLDRAFILWDDKTFQGKIETGGSALSRINFSRKANDVYNFMAMYGDYGISSSKSSDNSVSGMVFNHKTFSPEASWVVKEDAAGSSFYGFIQDKSFNGSFSGKEGTFTLKDKVTQAIETDFSYATENNATAFQILAKNKNLYGNVEKEAFDIYFRNNEGEVADLHGRKIPYGYNATGAWVNGKLDFEHIQYSNAVNGRINLDLENFNAQASWERADGLWKVEGFADGKDFRYYESNGSGGIDRSLEITRENGEINRIGSERINQIMDGNIDEALIMLKDDLGLDLDFDYRWGEGKKYFVTFDSDARLLSSNLDDNLIELKIGEAGYFRFLNPDNSLNIKIGKPSRNTLPLETMRYTNGSLTLNLDNTRLSYDEGSAVAGLYTPQNYLLEVQTTGLQAIKDNIGDAIETVKDGDFDKETRNQLIQNSVRSINVNFRELSKGYVSFRDQRWNQIMASLATDVSVGSLNSQDMIDIIDADDSGEQLYLTLERMLPQKSLNTYFSMAERSLFYTMAHSIRNPEPFSPGIGYTRRLSGTARGMFSSANNASSFSAIQNLPFIGMDEGYFDIAVSAFGPGSRTMLGFSSPVSRYYASFKEEFSPLSGLVMDTDALFYAYRLPDDFSMNISDNLNNPSSVNQLLTPLYSYDLNLENEFGVIIPGMIVGTGLKSSDDKWYTRLEVMPYPKFNLDSKTMDINLEGTENQDFSPARILSSFGLATDIRGGLKGDLLGQKAKIEARKDVNNYLSLAPELTLQDMFTLGIEAKSSSHADSPEIMTYTSKLNALGFETTALLEQNIFSKTDFVQLGLSRKAGKNTYEATAGIFSWNNDGTREAVERFYSFGLNLNDKKRLLQSFALNELTGAVRSTTSCQFRLGPNDTWIMFDNTATMDKDGTQWDTSLKGTMHF